VTSQRARRAPGPARPTDHRAQTLGVSEDEVRRGRQANAPRTLPPIVFKGEEGLLDAIRAHAAARPRFGYRRIHVLLRRGGWRVNHKRVYRMYRAEGLAVRRRKRKRMAVGLRTILLPPSRPNDRWSMDFTLDTLASGRRFRTLNIVDDFTRECVAIEVDTSLGGARVVRCWIGYSPIADAQT
jgi:transposase InsO family protein